MLFSDKMQEHTDFGLVGHFQLVLSEYPWTANLTNNFTNLVSTMSPFLESIAIANLPLMVTGITTPITMALHMINVTILSSKPFKWNITHEIIGDSQ